MALGFDPMPFFRRRAAPEPQPDMERLNSASDLLEFAETAYYPKFLQELEDESFKPLKIGTQEEMLQSAVRANTLREIRSTLVRRVAHARAAATETTEE